MVKVTFQFWISDLYPEDEEDEDKDTSKYRNTNILELKYVCFVRVRDIITSSREFLIWWRVSM